TMLLAPATVALGVPLYHNLRRIRQYFWPVMISLLVGGVFVTVLTILLAWLLGADFPMLMTLAPKSLTTPIAMVVADQLGGMAALAAGFVMYTAVLGALMGPWLLSVTGVTLPSARGMALGLAAHAVGTSRALEESEETGAFAALAMSLMGIGTALLLPLAVTLWLMLCFAFDLPGLFPVNAGNTSCHPLSDSMHSSLPQRAGPSRHPARQPVRSCIDGTGSAAAIPSAVCLRGVFSCHFPGVHHRAGHFYRLPRDAGVPHRQPRLEPPVPVLDSGIRRGLCHGRGVGHRHVLPVRHQLEQLLLCGGQLHRTAAQL